MITVVKGQDQEIVYTATELAVLNNPYFLFTCVNSVTNDKVSFVATNTSETKRYDKSSISSSVFADSEPGLWNYKIYEQASDTNTDPEGLNEVEDGYINLVRENDPEVKTYSTNNQYKAYNAEQ